MKLAALPIGAAVLLSIGAANAHAQYMEWTNVCLTGSLQACASASLKLQYDAALDRTTIRVTMANLQGADPGVQQSGVPYGIRGFAFRNIAALPSTPQEQAGFTNAIIEGNAVAQGMEYWIQGRRDTLADGRVLNHIIASTPQGNIYVWGCDRPPVTPYNRDAYQTCGGTLAMSFVSPGLLEFTESTTIEFGVVLANGEGGAFCRLGETCSVVTPEPGVLILLATGLIFVLGAALRARLA